MGWLKTSIFSWLGLMGLALYATDKWVTGTLLITGFTALAILDHIKRGYWKRLGVITADGSAPLFGHLLIALDTKVMGWYHKDKTYQKFKEAKYIGSYFMWSPTLLVTDPETIKAITIKDFDHFTDKRSMNLSEGDSWAKDMLIIAEGAHWKGIRSVLSPTFSSGKMKNMFPLVLTKADALMKKLHKTTGEGESTLDMKRYLGQLAIDVIGTCAFGLEIDCIEDDNAEFERKLSDASNQGGVKVMFQFMLGAISPKMCDYLEWTLFAPYNYFKDTMVQTVTQRRNHGVKRGDFVDLILEAQAAQAESESKKVEITDETITASAVIFLMAGYETVLNTIVIAAHLIAQHPEEQEKLREELREIVKEDGCLNYQNVMEAKYLEAFIFETQRMYPVGYILERKCTKEYLIPGTDIKILKDQMVQVPVWSLQNDELYWKEPSKFNPDRFLPENKEDIVQGTYMPFGIGPRNCIAMRFALMELKVALARLVQEFQLSLAPGREELGLKKGIFFGAEDTMPLVLTPLPEE